MPTVVLIGDSTRRRYEPEVRRRLTVFKSDLEVVSPEENCGTSADILANLDRWVLSRSPDLVHLNCGLHDLRWNPGDTGPQVTVEAYEANVGRILETLVAQGIATIWATSTPIDEVRHTMHRASRRTLADVKRYNAASIRSAMCHRVVVNDLFAAVQAADQAKLLGADGVHFTADGYVWLGARVAEAIVAAMT